MEEATNASQLAKQAAATNAASEAAANAAEAASNAAAASAAAASAAADAASAAEAAGVPASAEAVNEGSMAWFWIWLRNYMPQTYIALQGITFAFLVKTACIAGNVAVQLSPYPQVYRWENRGCVGESDSAPYVSIAFGGWQWCFYGLFAWVLSKRSGFLILVQSNILGALLGTYYCVAFCRHCRNPSALSRFERYLSAVASLVVFQACTIFVLPGARALFFTGLVSSLQGFLGAISILISVPQVLRSKDSKVIPGPLVWASFLSALAWCLCGWMLQDPLVMGPNVASVLACSLCIYLRFLYPAREELAAAHEEDLEKHHSHVAVPASTGRHATSTEEKPEPQAAQEGGEAAGGQQSFSEAATARASAMPEAVAAALAETARQLTAAASPAFAPFGGVACDTGGT
eukprot:TRINITY_DN10575_c1_g2_i1.p1 TRINITY_DN10575_c1_g2~~TRINITY_DN10575_c1_g2_i1.p1  ORF type:complete len:460 (+),score=114.51 TRINITY_DN10575_c1_g2_i1:167-1381(+)